MLTFLIFILIIAFLIGKSETSNHRLNSIDFLLAYQIDKRRQKKTTAIKIAVSTSDATFIHSIKPVYKQGKKYYLGERGYVHFANSGKKVHVWIMEKKIGRKLRPGEVVHHINGDKIDNRPSNLVLFGDQKKHDNHHRELLRQYGSWYGPYKIDRLQSLEFVY